ncbi:MAG TPA: alkaline phosphatase family protein [Acidimicrobiia bacterium]|nr:alkaline phosphatase family protein [Acidimicrobiia bacterium]
MTRPLVVVDVVGMTPRLLPHMPRLTALAAGGFASPLGAAFPAVTCSGQASLLTGLPPSGHGVVGNGWFFRDLGEVWLWRQGHGLVEGETVWEAARRRHPGLRIANLCWWYAMGAPTDYTVTPRPVYHADGRKSPDCYTRPPALHDELEAELGPFPLFQFWGPGARIASSRWIGRAAEIVLERHRPDVTFVYLPHLDYDLQRFGPDAPQALAAARAVDEVAGRIADRALDRGATVVALSEYGITAADRPVAVNRTLRRAGWLEVSTQHGMEYLDPYASAAFAVADHQVAHVYVRDRDLVDQVAGLLRELPGVGEVLDHEGKAAAGIDHPRAGELVAVAEPGAWFTYYYWLDDARAPDFARTVEIHRKPGYDPAELFFDPADRTAKARAGLALARKAIGLRYTMNVVPLDASPVRGTHGRLPDTPADGPVLVCSDARLAPEAGRIEVTGVKALLLDAVFPAG